MVLRWWVVSSPSLVNDLESGVLFLWGCLFFIFVFWVQGWGVHTLVGRTQHRQQTQHLQCLELNVVGRWTHGGLYGPGLAGLIASSLCIHIILFNWMNAKQNIIIFGCSVFNKAQSDILGPWACYLQDRGKNLGVIFDSSLKFDNQIKNCGSKWFLLSEM